MKPVLPIVTIFSKPSCCLCDKAKKIISKVNQDISFTLEESDITQNQELMEKYQYVIPVISINGQETFVSKVSELRLRRALENIKQE